MKKAFFFAVVIFAIASGIFFWNFSPEIILKSLHEHQHQHDDEDEEEHDHHDETKIVMTEEEAQNHGIQIKEVSSGSLTMTLSTRGKVILHPDKLAHVLPKVSGVAAEARKNCGDTVKAGEVIALIESREMAEMKANYLAALEKEKLAQSLHDRESRLNQKRVSAEQDYLNAQSAYEEAKINRQLAKHQLQAFGLNDREIEAIAYQDEPNLRLYEIRSPIDGIVLDRHMTQGEFIESNTPIYEIANLKTVWVEIGIYPKDVFKVKEGQIVDISTPVDHLSAQAKVIYLSPVIQEDTITARAIAELDNSSGNWRPGTFVKVNIITEQIPSSYVIPKEAVQNIEGQECVFIQNQEGFEKRPITSGRSDNENVEVVLGLQSGDKYAASKTFLLKADLGKNSVEHDD